LAGFEFIEIRMLADLDRSVEAVYNDFVDRTVEITQPLRVIARTAAPTYDRGKKCRIFRKQRITWFWYRT